MGGSNRLIITGGSNDPPFLSFAETNIMTITASHPFAIDSAVDSSAIQRIQIVAAQNSDIAYDAIITYNNGRDYRYTFEDDATARRWHELLTDDVARAQTSWGREVNRAIRAGDIEQV